MSDLRLATPVNEGAEAWAEFSLAVQEALAVNDQVRKGFSKYSPYRSPAFEPVRLIGAHPVVADLDAYDAIDLVDRAFCEIKGVSVGSDQADNVWLELLGDTNSKGEHVDPYEDFLVCWDACRMRGPNVLETAVQSAKENPRPADYFGERLKPKRRAKYRMFLTVAEELQLIQGDKPIYLPVRRLALLLNTDESQISTWRKLAQNDGFLEVVAEYKRGRLASEFLFHLPPKAS